MEMKIKTCMAIIMTAILVMAFTACGSGAEGEAEPEKEITNVAVYDDTQAEITDAEFFDTDDGAHAVRVSFKYTNNQADGLYMMECFSVHAFQNDSEINDITDINEEEDAGNSAALIQEVKDGESVECSYVFECADDSDVEVRVCTPTADEKLLAQKTFSK